METKIKFLKTKPELCMGCRNCELACTSRQMRDTEKKSAYKIKTRINVVQVENVKTPIPCRHCERPQCKRICPTNALINQDGVIYLKEEKCIGCGMCEQACPYGAISMSESIKDNKKPIASKCDMCLDRQENNESPACYLACPVKALELT